MPRGLSGWNCRDVISFLKDYKFEFCEYRKGSHEAWISQDKASVVEIADHHAKTIPPLTMKTMIRQSKLSEDVWREWAKNGKKRL